MVGWNAATLGVVGAGAALGFVIGGWLRDIPAVAKAADNAAAAFMRLFRSQETLDREALGNMSQKDWLAMQQRMGHTNVTGESQAKVIEAQKKAAEEAKRVAELLAKAEADTLKWRYDQQMAYYDALEKLAAESGQAVAKLQEQWAERQVEIAGEKAREILAARTAELNAEQDMMAAMNDYAAQIEAERLGAEEQAQRERIESWHSLGDAIASASDLLVALGMNADHVLVRMGDQLAGVAHAAGSFLGALKSGNAFDKIGAGLGLAGSVAGGIGNLLFGGQREHMKVNDMRDQFVEAAGGIEELDRKARAAGTSVDALLRADKVKEFESAVRDLNQAFDIQAEAERKLNDAIERYGLSIDQLGPKFAQQQLDQQAAQLFEDYQLLTAAGADHAALLEQMGPAFNDYVSQAISAGSTIPKALEPIINELFAQGKILDENGVAYENAEAAGISFAESQSEAFSRMADHLERLVTALERVYGLGPAPDPFANWTTPGGPPSDRFNLPEFAAGGDTDKGPGRGHRAGRDDGGFLAVLHPNETVVPDEDAEAFAREVLGGSSQAGSVTAAVAALTSEIRIMREQEKPTVAVSVNAPGATPQTADIVREAVRQELAPGSATMQRLDKRYARRN
jgi:hypothetical protein